MCNSADELTKGLDFLCLKESRLRSLTARYFFSQFTVCSFKLRRASATTCSNLTAAPAAPQHTHVLDTGVCERVPLQAP